MAGEQVCRDCGNSPVMGKGYELCQECFDLRFSATDELGNSNATESSAERTEYTPTSDLVNDEVTKASPQLASLESIGSGWLAGGAGAFVIGLIMFLTSSYDSWSPSINWWGVLFVGFGTVAIQFGFLLLLMGKHARVGAEVALYVAHNYPAGAASKKR